MLILLCPFRVSALAIDENTGSNWKRYTAFDGQVRKIMEGKRYVYIWAHQQLYSNGNGTRGCYSTPHGTVLYIDKNNPSKGVYALADDFATSGLDAKCVAYNPDKGVLVMAYTNGVVDIVRDGGEVHTVRDFDGLDGGMSINPLNISFDKVTGDIWIATSNGFVRIDGNKFTATDSADWGKSVNSICRVGDRVVAIVDNTIYEAPVSTDLQSLVNLKAHSGLASKIHGIMPMGDNVFATLTESKNLSLATISVQGDIKLSTQVSDSGFSGQLIAEGAYVTGNVINFNYILNDEYDNNFVLTRDGYLALSKTHLYLLKYNSGTKKIDVSKRKFNTDYVSSLARQAGSYDFENFWFYDLRKGFYCAQATGYDNSTAWTTDAERIQWQGPVAMQNAQLQYSSSKGMICMSRTSTMFSVSEISPIPMLLSGFRNDSWVNYSPIYTTPDFCATNSEAKKYFVNNRNNDYAYPIRHPNNFIVDSDNTDYVIAGSLYSGIVAMNLDNITGQIMHLTYEQDNNYTKYPGFKAVIPGNTKGCPALYVCGTDTEGNLWIFFPDTLDSSGLGYGINVYYWKYSDYQKALSSQDVSLGGSWGKIFFPYDSYIDTPGRLAYGLALRQTSNRNKLVFYPKSSPGNHFVIIVDHKGTFENSYDDEIVKVKHFSTSSGDLTNEGYINVMSEDPVSGDLYVAIANNIVRFNPNSSVINNAIEAEVLSTISADGSITPVAQYQTIHSIKFDEYNRMWIGTESAGVYGISADRKNLIAHYTTDNSPLLSNCINDICWNPDTQELFIATDGGIQSMNPYTPESCSDNSVPFVMPKSVTPDYTGTVRLSNLPAHASVIIENNRGEKIATLPMPVNRQIVWDTCREDGTLVPSGIYTFRDLTGSMSDIQISIIR